MERTCPVVPQGAPPWITAQLIEATLRSWQPHYDRRLTSTDAIEILLDVGRLLDLLEESDEEAVFGSGPSVEP